LKLNITLNADKTMMELALINLIENALKYSQSDVILSVSDNRFSVSDKGIGLDEKDIKNITAKFYRVRKNTWDNSMGLGLAIVDYILKLHNLELNITSKPNIGSNFSFNLKPILSKKS
jgi:signal transduction histidine kinase